MRKTNTISVLLVAILIASTSMLTSCKYEEGPSISLRSKKSRVVNEWKVDELKVNGENTPSSEFEGVTYNFKDDNSFEILFDGDRVEGTWDFNSNKEELILKEKDGSSIEIWKIMKLKNDELWVEYVVDGDKFESQFIPK